MQLLVCPHKNLSETQNTKRNEKKEKRKYQILSKFLFRPLMRQNLQMPEGITTKRKNWRENIREVEISRSEWIVWKVTV